MTTLPPRRIPYFVAGGTLGPHVPSYVKRPSDDELFEYVMMGELCYVLTPRQMGKSSLVARTIVRLKDKNIEAANIDLQDSGGLDEETFYLNILDELRRAFQLDIAVEEWWDENGRLGASLRFRRFFTDHLLPQVNNRVVIFIDEIDTMLTMPFRDNFFAAIRALYNGRADNPELERLTFVLLGVASPSELIKDPVRTPFNIGTKINLQEFQPKDVEPLLKGLGKEHPEQAKAILKRIFYWTSGHPYLTQRLCLLISQSTNLDWKDNAIDALVHQEFMSDRTQDKDDNIVLIQRRISATPNKQRLVRLYNQVYQGQIIEEDKASITQSQLLLSGLISVKDGQLQVRNQIYRKVFDRNWIRRETDVWLRYYFVAGGSLHPQIPSYVQRPADNELYVRTLAGELCYVLTPRQMGKSSLVSRTIVRLQDEKIGVVLVDLQDSGALDEDTFYLNIIYEICRGFQLDIAIEDWWDKNGRLGASLRFRRFFTDHLLPKVNGRVVIFIDEIDTMLTMPFRDNFFAAIRALYNGRADNPELERLTFVLLGVASPSELIKDPDRTPFNVGTKINLEDIKLSNAEALLKGLENVHPERAKSVLERIFYWTSGHPYLTQQLCLLISKSPDNDWTDNAIDDLIHQTFLSDEGRNEDNIKLIQSRISASPIKRKLLQLYRQIYRGQIIEENKASIVQNQLLLSGIISVKDQHLKVRNQIYHSVFDQSWIRRETEINWGVVIGAAGGLIAVLAILAMLYNSVLLPNQQRNFELTFLQATSAEERAEALGGLASIRPLPFIGDATSYEQSVNDLFFGLENWEEQKAIFDYRYFEDNPAGLVRLIEIIYFSMVDSDNSGQTTLLLEDMVDSLEQLNYAGAALLEEEIHQWIFGRAYVESEKYEAALDAYNNAISLNSNNPATLFERARVLTELGNLDTDLTLSTDYYNMALGDLDRVVFFILLSLEPKIGEALPTNTATRSPTATPTIISTGVAQTPNATLLPMETPSAFSTQINTRSQWLNLIRDFLQSESGLASALTGNENSENSYPSLSESGLTWLANIQFTVLPSLTNGLEWRLMMTGYYGNRLDVWQRFIDGYVPGMDWETFKEAVVVHNPQLETDGFIFYPEKSYLLPLTK